MQFDESIEQALRSPEPANKLRSLVEQRFAKGEDKATVLAAFENARQELRQAGREADEDAVMDVMDFLVGWCSPHMKLDPEKTAETRLNGHASLSDEARILPLQQDQLKP
jgi:hypothetical protein